MFKKNKAINYFFFKILNNEYYIYMMNKSFYTVFLLFFSYCFAQTNNVPTATDIFASTLKEKNTLIHLVGNDKDVNDVLTYSIVSVSGHGVLTDPLNSNAVLTSGSTLSNNGNSVNFVPNKAKFTSYIDKGTSSFTYKVNDGKADSTIKTVEIKVYEDFLANPSQVGLEVIGENAGDNLGFSVALNEKGDIMAVGSPKFGAATKGRVKVLKYNSVTNTWADFGNSIEGLVDGDNFGDSVSLSSDGTILAVGASYANNSSRPIGQVRVFRHNSGTSVWDVIGTINGSDVSSPKSESEQFGNDVRLSSDGKTLVVSDIEYNGGFGRVVAYRYDETNWNLIGSSSPIVGQSGDKGGWSVALSSNGNILAVGYIYHDPAAGSDAGQVKIFEYDGPNDKWNNKGVLFPTNQIAGEKFGASLDLSSDGLTLAVGSTNDKPNSISGEGSVSVYKWASGTTWTQMGSELKDEVNDGNKAILNYFGGYVSLNNSGNILGVLAPGFEFDGVRQNKGILRLYNYDVDSASWVKIKGEDFKILGEANGDYSVDSNNESKGQKVFLSGDGSFVALGAEGNDSNGNDSGHVRVFKLFDTQEIPVANPEEKTVAEKTELEITLTGTDSDNSPNALKYWITELESSTSQLYVDGSWIDKNSVFPVELTSTTIKFISNSETNTVDNLKFIVHDGKSSSAPATVKFNITLFNDAPVAQAQSITTKEDITTDPLITLTATDPDPSDTNFTYTITKLPSSGVLLDGSTTITTVGTDLSGATLAYKPNEQYNGNDSFDFTAKDDENKVSASATVSITVTLVNDAPVAIDDVFSVNKNSGTTSINVINNDVDVEGDDLELTAVSYSGTGTAQINADKKSIDYTPATDFLGDEEITYTVSDGDKTDPNGKLTVTVAETVNNAPVTVADVLEVVEDSGLTSIDVLANDSDPEGDALTLTDVQFDSGSGSGTLAINADKKSVDYTTTKDFSGVEAIKYTVSDGPNNQSGILTVTVTPVNDPPVVVNDVLSLYSTTSVINIDVLGNDSDPEGQNLTLTQVAKDQSGTVSINADNKSVDYTPSLGFTGDEVITYTVSDGAPLNNSATGTLTITVLNNSVPVSSSQTLVVEPNKDKSIVLDGTDADGDPLKYIIVNSPSNSGVLKDPNNNDAVLQSGSTISNNGNTVTFNSNNPNSANTTFSFKVNSCAVANPNNTSSLSVKDNNTGNELKAQRAYPMTTLPQRIQGNGGAPNDIYTMDVNVKLDLEAGNVFESCEIKLNVENFDDGLQFDINGKKILSFLEYHYNIERPEAADTQEFNGNGKFVINSCPKWMPWDSNCNGNPSLEIIADPQKKGFYKVQLMLDTVGGGREDALPYMDKTPEKELEKNSQLTEPAWVQESSFTYDCVAGFNLVIGNQNGGAGNGGITADLTVEAYVGPCDDSNVSVITTTTLNDPPVAEDQTIDVTAGTTKTIVLGGTDTESDPLTYVVTSLPSNGILKEGNSTILNADLPRVLNGNTLTYDTTTGGDVSFDFIVQQNSLATFAANNNLDFVVSGGKPVTFIKPEGKTYYLVQKNATTMDWPTAKALTDTFEGAQMFIPLDQNMDEAIYNALIGMNLLDPNREDKPFWYGLFQDKTAADWDNSKEPAGGWVWTDGIKLGSAQRPYVNWETGEPNNGSNKEDHAQFGRFKNTVRWNDMQPGANDSYPLFEFSVNSADDSNTATISIKVTVPNDPPVADSQNLKTEIDELLNITLTGSDAENDPLTYVVTSLPTTGQLKEGSNIISNAELPRVLSGNTLSYISNTEGDFSFNFLIKQNSLATFAKDNSMQFITQAGVPVTYNKPAGKTYFLIQETPTLMDWPDAKTLTDSFEGADMYIIIDELMETAVFQGLQSMNRLDGPFWMGLFQDKTAADWDISKEPDGGWVWTDGVKLGSAERPYVNWHADEPNESGPEDFGQFNYFSGEKTWNDMQIGDGQSYALFEFTTNDKTDSNTATINIKVEKTKPEANSQTLFFNEGSINNTIFLTGIDPKSKPISYIITSKPEKGTLKVGGADLGVLPATVNPNDITYTPENLDYYGDQKFNFKVNNGTDDSLSATVNIIITNVNDAPESDPGNYTTEEELPVEITHIGRDKDVLDIFTVHSQMGNDIPQPAGVQIGESVALSSDGKRIILGAYDTGAFARVYNWNGTDWVQLGATLNGDNPNDWFGEYTSISSDGNRIAIAAPQNDNANANKKGYVKVFDWDGTSWNAVGSPILGDNANDLFGFRGLHLSGDGNSLAVASFKGGYIHTYDWDGKVWKKRPGSFNIIADTNNDQSPGQVYLSMDGNRLVFGSVNQTVKGQVNVYDWDNLNNNWVLYAQINGTIGLFGNTVELTRDGKHLAVGEHDNSSVSVYDISGATPQKIGADITYGNQKFDFWRYISLSDDGKRLGIPNLNSKITGIFDWDGTSWNQLGNDIAGTGLMGESFDMSSDGTIIAVAGHSQPNKVFNVLNLKYIVTTLPSNGVLKEGAKTIVAGDLPYTLTTLDQKLTYTPNNNFSGTDSYKFKLNDGTEDSTDKDSGLREDSTITITINDFVLALPNNYTITPTETCAGSNFGIIDLEVKETTYQKNKPSGRVIPLNYNVKITGPNGFDQTRTITSPSKKLDTPLENLEKGSYELTFTVPLATNPAGGGESPPYTFKQTVVVIETVAPIAHPVADIEVCDDNVDGDDTNGKVNFVIDTPTLITSLLTDSNTGVVQDVNLFDFEFEYLDDTTSKKEKIAVLPDPLYSANQTILVTMTSKANGKCVANQSINLVVNKLPVFDRIEDTKSVCTNLPPVTIGVASTDSRVYTYTWTRNGVVFPPNIVGIDSSISIGTGGEYIVTATTTDGTNCSKSMTIQMKESSIATITEKDITKVDLQPGPNNSITVSTATLGIGDYEFAIDDATGPYQDDPLFKNVRPGKHTIFVRDKNNCGIASVDTWIIGYKKFFTPNGDGYTDNWNVIGITSSNQSKTKVYIFDRYGKLLKELDPLSKGWDGNFNGNPMPQTDYWFKIILEDGRELKGNFSLYRGW